MEHVSLTLVRAAMALSCYRKIDEKKFLGVFDLQRITAWKYTLLSKVWKFSNSLAKLRFTATPNTNQQSAQKLSISQSTLKFHMTNIFQKLGVQTRSEALVLAAKTNLI